MTARRRTFPLRRWENKRAGQGVGSTRPALAPVRIQRNEGSTLSTPQRTDNPVQAPPDESWQAATIPAPGRHYFVPDQHGFYCLACSTPRGNARHVSKAA